MIFMNMTPKTQATKTKIGESELIKRKSFHTAKETTDGGETRPVKREPAEWEEVFEQLIQQGVNFWNT